MMTNHMSAKGTLIPIGGNEDKGIEENEMYTLDFIQESILSHVVRESGGKKAKVVVIPTASSIPVEVADNYMKAFDKLGCSDIRIVDIRKRSHAGVPFPLDCACWVASRRRVPGRSLRDQAADCRLFLGSDRSGI